MRTLIAAVVVLLASVNASAQFSGAFGGSSPFSNGCRILYSTDHTRVTSSTTFTSDASASKLTIFSTATLSNVLPDTGGSVIVSCAGTISPLAEIRTIATTINGVVISSRTISIGSNGVPGLGWRTDTELVRTAPGAQNRNCIAMAAANSAGNCSGSTAAPIIGSGTNTLDEAATWTITCAAGNVTAGSTSFLTMKVMYCPGS